MHNVCAVDFNCGGAINEIYDDADAQHVASVTPKKYTSVSIHIKMSLINHILLLLISLINSDYEQSTG